MPDMARIQPVADRIIDTAFSSLTERERVFFLLWSYASVVDNGGLPSFFYNSPADYYSETLDAFRKLKLENFALLLERSTELLFAGDVPPDNDDRNAALDEIEGDDAIDEEIEKLDRLHFEYGGGDSVLNALELWFFGNDRSR